MRLSKTFFQQLHILLEPCYPKFGERVVLEKRNRVFRLIEQHLISYPRIPLEIDPERSWCWRNSQYAVMKCKLCRVIQA